jgi:hypothetical protein
MVWMFRTRAFQRPASAAGEPCRESNVWPERLVGRHHGS